MIKIYDKALLNEFIEKFQINGLFSEDMTQDMELVLWNKSEYICQESESLNYLYFIVQGKAKVCKNMANGKSLLICFYRPFRMVGDVEFTRTNSADCTVQAIEDTYGIGISFNVVRTKLFNDCKFLFNICGYLGEKLSISSTNSSINILYSLENKLASYIYAYADGMSERDEFVFEGSYSEIAELLGTSYRHLNRVLNKFCREGILEKKQKSYLIKDIKKLERLSGDLYIK
ncbi:helix-turn-helix domain-containing protein [uncultured Clostridium sp.]|uniref:helix-turn-helix domain-containing protein n=1 Tax=uncultured Clostridium sp. TaxID=59620 RepID=UPI0025F394BC|nr:helix-turn-helix domain-containing protein [uncultured Clostridium sp.]